MKRYKRILAGILAINLAVSALPTTTVTASTIGKSQSEQSVKEEAEDASASDAENAETSADITSSDTESTSKASDNTDTEGTTNVGDNTDTENTINASDDTDAREAESTSEENAQSQDTTDDITDDTAVADTENEDNKNADVEVNTQEAVQTGSLEVKNIDGWDDGKKTLTVTSAAQLILLSYCNPEQVKGIIININMSTGEFALNQSQTGTELKTSYTGSLSESATYSFQGIGTQDYPFEGTITGQNITWAVNRAVFGGLSSKAQISVGRNSNLNVSWRGDETSPIVADLYQFDSESEQGHSLPISVTRGKVKGNDGKDTDAKMGSLLGIVQASSGLKSQTLNITAKESDYYGEGDVNASVSTGNAGLICNTLKSGTICLNGYSLSGTNYTVNTSASYSDENDAENGNAGLLIGTMESGTTLKIQSELVNTEDKKVSVSSTKGNSGGLVGLMQNGARIVTEDKGTVTLNQPTVTGGKAAGGIAGKAEDVIFVDNDMKAKITMNKPAIKASRGQDGVCAGGFIGRYILNAEKLRKDVEPNLKSPAQIVIQTPNVSVTDGTNGFVGGYFGYLDLHGKLTYAIGSANNNEKLENNPTYDSTNSESCGAIAGKVTSDTIKSTLQIQNVKISATCQNAVSKYHGGLIGEVGIADGSKAVYLQVNNVDISVQNPQVGESDNNGFGGLVGFLTQGSILKAENTIKVSTSGEINQGGGFVGYAEKSVIDVSGKTDLSGVIYQKDKGKSAQTGWFVGRQESALIYAEGDGNGNGWSYIRGKENTNAKQAMNDIGNYGQIIRLNSGRENASDKSKLNAKLISINADSHAITYAPDSSVTVSENTITINSANAFALLSIAWNTRGYFGNVSGITSDSFSTSSLKSKNITLSADIDLTGSGITGLSRDLKREEDTYTGRFDGENHMVTLSVGETFGFKQNSTTELAGADNDGYGEVIAARTGSGNDIVEYHSRQGLFAKVSGAKIQNLTVSGTISVSNAGKDILAGGVAGEAERGTTASNVIVRETINADGGGSDNTVLALGGFYGGSYAGDLTFGEINNENIPLNKGESVIKISGCTASTKDDKIYAGGLVGEINNWSCKLQLNQVQIAGNITTDATKNAYVGGLIGILKGGKVDWSNGGSVHWIEIRGVAYNGFKIDAPNVTIMCGGLIGSTLENAGLYFMGEDDNSDGTNIKFDVRKAEINAPKANDIGGLAYQSTGHWEIRDYGIKLDDFKITAKKNVGLLVCKGSGKYYETKTIYKSLYLNTTKYWDSSYEITEKVSIKTNSGDGIFDEFVAYTTPTPSKSEILDNSKNGVISIATQDDGKGGRVGVDGADTCTTYQNRTNYGKEHPTNAYSRYYYDLDQCVTDMSTGTEQNRNNNEYIDTPQELLLWSVYNYAPVNIRPFLIKVADLTKKIDVKKEASNIGKVPDINVYLNRPSRIGGKNDSSNLDLSKYSYYPIKFETAGLAIMNTTITFNSENIEKRENSNKSTQGETNGNHTQHYTMHSGILLTYRAVNTSGLTVSDVTFSGSIGKVDQSTSGVLVADRTLGYSSGTTETITKIDITNLVFNGLKVVDCGNDYAPLLINYIGNRSQNNNYGYVTLTVNGITVKGYDENQGTPVASSLIGDVGTNKEQKINMSFQKIVLPDKKADGTKNGGIFSHATLLESFSYNKDDNASGATYNFYSTEDWPKEGSKHQVTYGKEITGTTEFTDLQKWYYDESTYETNEGLVYDDENKKYEFNASGYLPYVCTVYNKDNDTHEIKVNQRVINIVDGCGTYGHPYRITKESEMNILSEYLATGQPRKDWRVKITKDQATSHTAKSDTDYTSENDVIYQYDGIKSWIQVENNAKDGKDDWHEVDGTIKLDKDFMRSYLQNAYYDIRGTEVKKDNKIVNQLTLNNFKGLGTDSQPFRGVITSKNNTTIILQGEETANGLIPYSYGSVVKNLAIQYTGTGKTLTYSEADSENSYYPKFCFGGVIGCVLGGDNIIDGVTVTMDKNWLTLSGEKKHLIQAGGYVGSVSGGGVIFRDMTDGTGITTGISASSTTETRETQNILSDSISKTLNPLSEETEEIETDEERYPNLYVNPFVGRVLDGFAFYEKISEDKNKTIVESLENTNQNYKIVSLEKGKNSDVTVNDNKIIINNAQGMLILSAIVNSGAGSNGISYAYSKMGSSFGNPVSYNALDKNNKVIASYSFGGKYGKVRNASCTYSKIGTDDSETSTSATEDKNLPGDGNNLPYLIQKYCGSSAEIFDVSSNSDIEVSNGIAEIDLSGYENGYQGIGARYVSYAVRGQIETDIKPVNHPEGIVPEIKAFNGNDKKVTMKVQTREYTDDDFHAASVGGVFNVLRVGNIGSVSKLTIDQQTADGIKPVVSLAYYNSNGNSVSISKTSYASLEDVGVGGLIGSLVGYTGEVGNRDITMEKIQLTELTVTGQSSTGGIVGNTGKPTVNTSDKDNSYDISVLLQPQKSQIAYGIAFHDCSYKKLTVKAQYSAGGFVGYIGNKDQNPKSTVNENVASLTRTKIGESSSIEASDDSSWAGGLFGYVGTRMFINMTDGGEKKETKAVLQDVNVKAGTAVGGCIGWINEKCYGIHNVIVKGEDNKITNIVSTKTKSTQNSPIYAGGVVGYAKGAKQNWTERWTNAGGISDSSVEKIQINTSEYTSKHDYSNSDKIQTNYIVGGIVGQTAGGETRIEGCTVNSSNIYGSVAGGITGQTDSLMEFERCTVKGSDTAKMEIKGFSTAGGILGFWTENNAVTIQNSNVQYLDIEGKDWGVGTMIGDSSDEKGGVGELNLFDSSAKDSNVLAGGNNNNNGGSGGRWPCVGSITGNLRNTIKASNILFSDITLMAYDGVSKIGKEAKKGLLFGNVVNTNTTDIQINIAGISIQNISESNQDWKLTGGGTANTDNDYIAFADYSGSSLNVTEKNKINNLYEGTKMTSPYVVTSPVSNKENETLKVYQSESGSDTGKILYGDGALWKASGSTFTLNAQEIWKHKDDVKNNVQNKHYSYQNITDNVNNKDYSVGDFKFDTLISTYNANQNTKASNDFPVLQLGSGNASVITDYLNILTNGAFSAANAMNKGENNIHVKATAEVYEYKNNKFVKASDGSTASESKAFKVTTDSNGKITFLTTTGYDNDKNRFNLLKVTFTENGHEYNVFVPILVRRMLEIDFCATLDYGTNFNSSNYRGLTHHVLESYGSSISGYLTYTYNSDENSDYTDYGWQSYINAGGNVMDMKKSLHFQMATKKFPKDTQLTLVDAKTGKAYYYSATGKEEEEKYENSGISIPLSKFTDSSGNSYREPSVAELMGAKVSTSSGDKLFIEVNESGKPLNSGDSDKAYPEPTVRIGDKYYRLADTSLEEKGTCSIIVDENSLKTTETTTITSKVTSSVKENYYLVVTVPKNNETVQNQEALNGTVRTIIESSIPHQVHYLKINGKDDTGDNNSNAASTYQISNGYRQTLTESKSENISKKIDLENLTMEYSLSDKITFPKSQVYQKEDELYLRFVAGLQKTIGSGTSNASTSAEQFPSGTTGQATFSVYKKDDNEKKLYYSYNNGKWTLDNTGTVQTVASYTWTSDGGNMELPLSTDGTIEHAISLAGVRTDIKGSETSGDGEFYVEVNLKATLPATGLDVIPQSSVDNSNRPSDYTKFSYFSQLSTVTQSLTYSNNRATASGETEYYRAEPAGVKLTYEADEIDQLGINLLDLRYLDSARQNSLIETTAKYDLSTMKNLTEVLKESDGIRFKLTLSPKNTGGNETQEGYGGTLTNAEDYLDVKLKSSDSGTVEYDKTKGTWSWKVPKTTYWDETADVMKTDSVFDGNALRQQIQLKVRVDNIEDKDVEHYYSNYKVTLSAEFVNAQGEAITSTQINDYLIYSLVRINQEFKE